MKPAATTVDEKVRLTEQVETFEGFSDQQKVAVYPAMVSELGKYAPWLDTAPSWRQLSGIGNYDTYTALRNRVEKSMPQGSAPRARQDVAAPRDPGTAGLDWNEFYGEVSSRYVSLVNGIDGAFQNLGISAETAAQLARIVPPLTVIAIGTGLYYRTKGK